eukprot:11044603-Alexandrium_andersonii.AAC.1
MVVSTLRQVDIGAPLAAAAAAARPQTAASMSSSVYTRVEEVIVVDGGCALGLALRSKRRF